MIPILRCINCYFCNLFCLGAHQGKQSRLMHLGLKETLLSEYSLAFLDDVFNRDPKSAAHIGNKFESNHLISSSLSTKLLRTLSAAVKQNENEFANF